MRYIWMSINNNFLILFSNLYYDLSGINCHFLQVPFSVVNIATVKITGDRLVKRVPFRQPNIMRAFLYIIRKRAIIKMYIQFWRIIIFSTQNVITLPDYSFSVRKLIKQSGSKYSRKFVCM